MVASAGTADEQVVINAKGVLTVFVEALAGGFDTSHSDAGGGEAWRGGGGRVGIPDNSSASYTILVTGNGFVTRQEELFHATNLLVSGQPPPTFTRGYSCSLCFVRAREGGSPVVGLCPSVALQMEAEVMNSSFLSCLIASSAVLTPPPSATPHLRLSISRVDIPYQEPGGRVGGGGGGWGGLKGSQVSSCPVHLQDIGVGGGEGVRRCLRGGYPLGISLAVVGHVTKISQRCYLRWAEWQSRWREMGFIRQTAQTSRTTASSRHLIRPLSCTLLGTVTRTCTCDLPLVCPPALLLRRLR